MTLSFGQWLLISLLPPFHPWRRRVSRQLRTEISAQIERFNHLLSGATPLALDGHQHIHLVPLIHDTLLKLAKEKRITWMRSTAEPLPTGLTLSNWSAAIHSAGRLKWGDLKCSPPGQRGANAGRASPAMTSSPVYISPVRWGPWP